MRIPRNILTLSLLALASFALAAAACGGRTLENETDGGPGGSSTDDRNGDASSPPPTNESSSSGGGGSSGGDFPVCPNPSPKPGWSCSTPNQGCAYFDYDTGTCTSVTCDPTGHWVSSTPAGC